MNQTAYSPAMAMHLECSAHRRVHIEKLENSITELSAHIHAATYRLLELIREYDDSEGWCGPGLNSCAHWLNWKCGINLGAVREKVRVAHALKELPNISEVFRNGEVSYSKVRAMTRVATRKNEDYLLMIARHGTAAHVERAVRQYRKVKRIEALELENERHATRELSWYFDHDGCLVFKGRFTPEHGALIIKALESAMDDLYAESAGDAVDVSAETSVDISTDVLKIRPEPVARRRADAMLRVAEGFLAGATRETSGGRYTVNVHTDMETLKADGTGAESEIEESANVSAETSRRLACDAAVVHWLQDHKGEALSVGRKTRTIPPAIRRALHRRDQGCRFPGCSCTRFVDAHHIRHWADGGDTGMENLVLLCRRHHRLVHEGGFAIRRQANGEFFFTNPMGKHIPDAAKIRFRGNVVSLFAEHGRSGIHITPRTGECLWEGEHMDDDLTVSGLLQME